jgi:5-hydroxyisourate hydrolase-like protein (transthyretin family)
MALLLATAGAQQTPVSKPTTVYRIAGTVVNAATGEPVRRATVAALSASDHNTIESAETDSDGRFALEGLAAAKYELTASRRGFLTTFYDEHEGHYNTAIVTGKGQQTEDLIFRLTPAASLHGVVTDEGGDPVENAKVLLFLKPRSHNPGGRITQAAETTTDDTGAYDFGDLAPGEYFLAVSAKPWYALHHAVDVTKRQLDVVPSTSLDVAYPITFFDSTTDEASATPIVLAAGSHEEANISLHAVPALHLVFNPQGVGDEYQGASTLYQSIFGTHVSVGDLTLFPGAPPDFSAVAPGHYVAVQGVPERIMELDAKTSQQVDTSLGKPTIAVTGITQTSNGTALQGQVKLTLESLEITHQQESITTEYGTGEIEFLDVPQGNWELWAEKSGKALPVTSITVGTRTHAGNQLTVLDQPLKVIATVSLSETRVEGYARKDGKGLPGVMVVLVPKEPAAFRALARRDQSDSDGSFALRDVAPGQYTVVAIEDGWELDWERPEVMGRYLPGGISVTVTESSGKLLRLSHEVPVQSR